MRQSALSLVLALGLGLALGAAGCGSKSDTGNPTNRVKAATVKKPLSPADQLSPNLVPAVATGKAGAGLLQVKLEMAAPPVVGDPVDIDMVILPSADNLDRFSGTIQGDDGLDIVAGDTIAPVEKPLYGNPVHHSLKVLAKHDGIYILTASIAVESGGQVQNPVFSFPVIGGNGLSDTGSAPGPNPARAPAASAAH
ncbi:MAG: hypothetical protein ACLPQ6_04685 [Steroidobacteraceae bacterium]